VKDDVALMKLAGWVKNRHLPLILLIVISTLVGFMVARNYGTSWDEPGIVLYTDRCLQAYPAFLLNGEIPNFGDTIVNNYGPAFFILDAVLARVITWIFPAWSTINAWHFGYFLSFQMAVVSLYFLCRKWMDRWASFGAAVLFSTQPLLWGHAFINPKDIPFMAFFLASVTAGFSMVDTILARRGELSSEEPHFPSVQSRRTEWKQVDPRRRRAIGLVSIGLLALLLFLISGAADGLAGLLTTTAYQAEPESIIGSWFGHLASNSDQTPVEAYVAKAQVLLQRGVLSVFFVGVLAEFALIVRALPAFTVAFRQQALLPYIRRYVFNPGIFWAAILLGFTTSIRIIGPFAGGLVLLYALSRSWSRAALIAVPYGAIAILVCLFTWPYLWGNPIDRFVESLTIMVKFPWHGLLLFRGVLLPENAIPWYFLPYMLAIQLTEVVLPLFLTGTIFSVFSTRRRSLRDVLFLVLFWFVGPLVMLMAFGSTVYDNFRQYFFLLPPLFIAAGIGLEAVLTRLPGYLGKIVLLAALLLPGIYAIIDLHPYQYVYYNSFVGGVRGAFRQYELDYWGTSYAEAASYLNAVAPTGSSVVVMGPMQVFQEYARADLVLVSPGGGQAGTRIAPALPGEVYDYLLVYTRKNEDWDVCRDNEAIHTIGRDTAVFSVIRRISGPADQCILVP
jgi:4-amino-4-deoxy-L-arabinose transferase-like glycosyltransferase